GVQLYEEQIMINKMRTVNKLAKELNMEVVNCQNVN
ncbi:hypothetical protein SAMN05444285_12673, partial [Draconibacterium orientale]